MSFHRDLFELSSHNFYLSKISLLTLIFLINLLRNNLCPVSYIHLKYMTFWILTDVEPQTIPPKSRYRTTTSPAKDLSCLSVPLCAPGPNQTAKLCISLGWFAYYTNYNLCFVLSGSQSFFHLLCSGPNKQIPTF